MNNFDNFVRAYQIELSKLFKRKDTFLMFLMPAISLFYAIGFSGNVTEITYTGTELFDAFSFVSMMIIMVNLLFMFYIFFGFISARSLATEIEDKSMLFYLPRLKNRSSVYFAKIISLVTVVVMSILFFAIVSFAAYYGFLVKRTDVANGLFSVPENVLKNIGVLIAFAYNMIFALLLMFVLSTRFKLFFALSAQILIFIILIYVYQFNNICYLSPFYYISEIPKKGSDVTTLMLLNLLWFVITSVVLTVVGKYNFVKRDL